MENCGETHTSIADDYEERAENIDTTTTHAIINLILSKNNASLMTFLLTSSHFSLRSDVSLAQGSLRS